MLNLRLSAWAVAFLGIVAGTAMLVRPGQAEDKAVDTTVYELRTYVCHEGRLPALHARFRDHTMKLFEKHGMKNGMYWTPTDGEGASNTLIYVLEHKSREAATKSWAGFRADPDWLAVKTETEKDAPIVASVTSVFMTPTDFSPGR
ncbi:MAG: NIPSNAP family protein [Pirellulales bacterium]